MQEFHPKSSTIQRCSFSFQACWKHAGGIKSGLAARDNKCRNFRASSQVLSFRMESEDKTSHSRWQGWTNKTRENFQIGVRISTRWHDQRNQPRAILANTKNLNKKKQAIGKICIGIMKTGMHIWFSTLYIGERKGSRVVWAFSFLKKIYST